MTYKELKNSLIKHPKALLYLCSKFGISTRRKVFNPCFGVMNTQRLLSATVDNGFRVTFEVDDDDLSPAQRKMHYADLADKCIKKLKAKGFELDE